jgi:hypothetical protein
MDGDHKISLEEFLEAVQYKENRAGKSTEGFRQFIAHVAQTVSPTKKAITGAATTCWPPPIFILLITIVEIAVYIYYASRSDCSNLQECRPSFLMFWVRPVMLADLECAEQVAHMLLPRYQGLTMHDAAHAHKLSVILEECPYRTSLTLVAQRRLFPHHQPQAHLRSGPRWPTECAAGIRRGASFHIHCSMHL